MFITGGSINTGNLVLQKQLNVNTMVELAPYGSLCFVDAFNRKSHPLREIWEAYANKKPFSTHTPKWSHRWKIYWTKHFPAHVRNEEITEFKVKEAQKARIFDFYSDFMANLSGGPVLLWTLLNSTNARGKVSGAFPLFASLRAGSVFSNSQLILGF